MDAFKVIKDGKTLDYRVGQELDLGKIKEDFSKKYEVIDLKQGHRHVIGKLAKDGQVFFLKLSTTVGIGARTETERIWNEEYNKLSSSENFVVPKNVEDGYYNSLYFLITEYFEGDLVAELNNKQNSIEEFLEPIIDFSEHIQRLPINIPVNDAIQTPDHIEWFKEKTQSWLDSIPEDIRKQYDVESLWNIVVSNSSVLEKKPRHGDFTPWHMITPDENTIVLLDGEHAHSNGVEYYDIAYFIQRVHSILGKSELALEIFNKLIKRGYDKEKLRTVLASRAIGGFLDESFKENADYISESVFKNWVINL